jgi:hypothetical protein
MIKSRGVWAGKIVFGKPEGKILLERPRRKWQVNNKADLK